MNIHSGNCNFKTHTPWKPKLTKLNSHTSQILPIQYELILNTDACRKVTCYGFSLKLCRKFDVIHNKHEVHSWNYYAQEEWFELLDVNNIVITVFHLLLALLFSFYSLISNKTCFIGYILKEIIKKKTLTVFTLKPVQGYVFLCVWDKNV